MVGFVPAALPALLHHFVQVVDVVEVDVVQVVDVGVQVPGHRDVDEEQGPLLAPPHHPLDLVPGDEQVPGAGGADEDVGEQKLLRQFFQGDRLAVEPPGQGHAPLQGAVGHGDGAGALPLEVLQGQFRHLAGPQ